MNTCSKHSYEAEAQEFVKMFLMEDVSYSHCLRYIYKKAGLHCCCSASQGPGIAYHLNKQHRSPRRYVRSRTHLPTVCTDMYIHTPRTSKCCNVLGEREICEIPISQAQSVFDAFIMSVIAHLLIVDN